ncbi:MAG: OmpA family protein [Bacteroidales bacterium]|nr:OmpA family protein [Bacteroidales bacterium]
MKKLFLIAIVCLAFMLPANAQILKRIGESAARAAESAVSNQINRKIDEGIDDAFNKNKKNKNKDAEQAEEIDDEEEATSQSSKKSKAKQPRTIEAAYSKCDFVPGDEIIFDDDLVGEQLGEFPSKWDLLHGVSEVVKFDGRMTFDFQDENTRVAPLMKNPHDYLTDEFTVECDFFAGDNSTIEEGLYSRSHYRMDFISEADGRVMEFYWHTADVKNVQCWYTSTTGDGRSSEADISALLVDGEWNHLSISFNKRAFKAYINGTRVINIPNMKAPNYLELESRLWGDHGVNYVTNFRICKGAVPLYDRLTTDGKIITYGITFDTGKATIKPESMSEINRIKNLMDEDESLNFEVQGHCDATGSAATNQKLSQERAEAIVAKLVEMGIDESRLTAVGKGSSEPIADNSTDEGRAKNRRVEFVKK